MQALKELALIVNKNKIRSIELMSYPFGDGSKLSTLYEGVLKGSFETDEEAIGQLYDKEHNTSAYRKLKSTLRNRLLNTLFFIDVKQPSYNSYQRAYYECYRDWAAIKILLGKNARNAAISLGLKVLRYAEKYEFSFLCMEVCDMLRFHYGAIEGDFKKFEAYDQQYQKHAGAAQYENQAKELYLRLAIHYVNGRSQKKEVHQQALASYQQLQAALRNCKTHDLYLYAFLIKLIIHTSVSNHEETVEVCEEAIRFFSKKGFEAHVPLQIFYYQQLVCYIQLHQFEKGRAIAEKCLSLMEEGGYNWFKYLELYFILSMHTRQYEQAYEVYKLAVGHQRFSFLPENVQELWRIYEAYLHYLALLGKLQAGTEEARFSKFRLGRFLNETPIFSQDKQGLNISILLIQILFFILRKDYDQAGDRIQAIEQYCHRYLKKDDTYRSNCFIKMLLHIPKANFHKAAVLRQASRYFGKLQAFPIEISNQAYEVEIIPYEDLWEMAVQSLENKFFRQRRGLALG